MIIYDKEKISEKVKLENDEEPILMINFDPKKYSIRYTFTLLILFIIYFITFLISMYYNPNILSIVLLIFISSLTFYYVYYYYNKAKNYYIIITNKRIIQLINENIYSIKLENIYNVEIYQSLYEKIKKYYSLKIYTDTLLINKNINVVIEIPLLNKEDCIKIRDELSKISGKDLSKKIIP